MAGNEMKNGFKVWKIVAKDGSIEASFVPEKGGLGASIVVHEEAGPRELLYQHPFFWDEGPITRVPGGWPFLFPICGRLEREGDLEVYRYDDQLFRMPSHGFALRMPWTVENTRRKDELVMTLSDTEETRAQYPFSFTVRLRYRVEARQLTCEQTYCNNGYEPMPYYAGFHPYFLTPDVGPGKDATLLHMAPTRRNRYNERLTETIGHEDAPAMPIAVSSPNIQENLLSVETDKVTRLTFPDRPGLTMEAQGLTDPDMFPYVQLYTMEDKPFFCIEPWMGAPNSLNAVGACRLLPPGGEDQALLVLSAEG